MTITGCDIYDEIDDDPAVSVGVGVFNSDVVNQVNANGNYWGEDPLPTGGLVTCLSPLNAPLDEVFYGQMAGIDDANTFYGAIGAFEEGDFNVASRLAYQFVSEAPNDSRASQALNLIKACLKRTDCNYGDFREYCLELVEEQGETAVGMAARWMAIDCLTAAGDYRAARAEYEDIVQNGNGDNALIANLRLLYVDLRENGNRVDAAGSHKERREALLAEANLRHQKERQERLELAQAPSSPAIQAAYPNPFNASTLFTYSLPGAMDVSVVVFDIRGREVTTLFRGNQQSGNHSLAWNAANYPAGEYVIRLKTDNGQQTSKVVTLLK